MARLNIEDPFWIEVISLVAKAGDQDKAIGNAVRFFRFAQEKHKHGQLITEEEFTRQGFMAELIPTFAERVEGGIRVLGAEKHFGWLRARVNAGKRGGSKPKQTKANRSKRKQPEASPSPSYSSSLSSSGSDSSVGETAPAEPPPPDESAQRGNALVAEFYDFWRLKHGGRAPLLPADHKKLKDLGEQLGHEPARKLIQDYFKVPNEWFAKKKHDVQTLMSNLSEVQAYSAKKAALAVAPARGNTSAAPPPAEPAMTPERRRERIKEIDAQLAGNVNAWLKVALETERRALAGELGKAGA